MTKREYKHEGRVHSVTLTFPLPEEQAEFEAAWYGGRYQSVLHDLFEKSIRNRLKYPQTPPLTEGEKQLLATIRQEVLDSLDDTPLGP
jgi:hypothetical protein